ncbi:NTF2-like N-terminal transpeptidase domain-containing protein [Amycolatopsis marina]|uniref:NTF2-like N-terminal transpeptidase domain-containing protein n=1 Tax=Amycolatopsis marina TaxID=490629 RepID=A0A1I1AKK4_9PSEU|nr:penicillin-binding transpeptidase domain-containing protein [Amycolatopsis marina]SFB38555.1 NTF2-like N-terminal transpeptidase domain-containing protein [Amycolatopsis marina]
MRDRTRRGVLIGAATAMVAIVVAGVVILQGGSGSAGRDNNGQAADGPEATAVARDYLLAFSGAEPGSAAALTDDPAAAEATILAVHDGLKADDVVTDLGSVITESDGQEATGTVSVKWTLGPDRVWTYETSIRLVQADDGWRVRWDPSLIHPSLGAGESLLLHTREGAPAVLDRTGETLLTWRDGVAVPAEGVAADVLTPGMARTAAEQSGSGQWSVARVGADDTELERLAGGSEQDAKPLTATVSRSARAAAQRAVDSVDLPTMLVALEPGSGDILAVAQNAEAGAQPNALSGLYPPGSTFKIATAVAALSSGNVSADTVLDCPGTATIGTRTIPNDGEFALGRVPLHTAFAKSCNTTFGALATKLPADGLSRAAGQLGLNADFAIPGISTELGRADPAADPVLRLEEGIGQGELQASPFGLAVMVATVAGGEAVTPALWRDLETTVNSAYQAPPESVLAPVRGMMREVVTGGTATALSGRGTVLGKTGTAQFSDGSQAHGWFAGYRDDVAFAVLTARAGTSDPAVAVSGRFLDGL